MATATLTYALYPSDVSDICCLAHLDLENDTETGYSTDCKLLVTAYRR